METYIDIYGLVDKRKLMYDAIDLYKKTRHYLDLANAKKEASEYAKLIKHITMQHPDILETEYFSNKERMTQPVIDNIREILLGRRLRLPAFLRVTTSGAHRVTTQGNYRVYAT